MQAKILNMFSLEGKVAVITGGGQGLGKELANGMAQAGAKVAVVSRNSETCKQTAREIRESYGVETLALSVDIRNIEEIQRGMDLIDEKLGGIDILVNNSGVASRTSVFEMDETEFYRVIDTNVKGLYFCTQAAVKRMAPKNAGKIINIASISSFRGLPQRSMYAISKGAVLMATRTLALDLAPYNINVNAIAPSYIHTPMTESLYKDEQFYSYLMSKTPLKKIIDPEEIVGAAIYLASNSSSMVTGAVIPVDGGWLAE